MYYEYQCDTKIIMGPGETKKLASIISEYINDSETVMVITDKGVKAAGLCQLVEQTLENAGYNVITFDGVSPNPRDTECITATEIFKETHAALVVAVGGGSPMDMAKAVALLGSNGGTLEDYTSGTCEYENVTPVICIPTTAGTGSEVTRSSVITLESSHKKITLKHPLLRPRVSILDPEFTLSVPKSVTAATGVDALVHAIEGYTSKVTNPVSQAVGERAMKVIIEHLPTVYEEGDNLDARYKMQQGSVLAGLCFGSADVAGVHCLAEALGSLYDTPHGVANAIFLPHVVKFNAEGHEALHRELSSIMGFSKETDSEEIAVQKLIDGLYDLTRTLDIPTLKSLGYVRETDFERMAALAVENNSTPSNVRTVTYQDYLNILSAAY